MARIIQKSADCEVCDRRTLAEKKAPRHGMHAVLFLATFGMSSVTSAATYAGRAMQEWRCQSCGSAVTPMPDPDAPPKFSELSEEEQQKRITGYLITFLVVSVVLILAEVL